MFDTITDLAREKSSDKRRELLGRVADLFFDGAEHHSQKEAVIFRDIVLKMLDDVDRDGRSEFSKRAAPQESLPADVARQLAQDDVSVAGPMLQNSPVLTDEDFVSFSQSLSPKHLESIAQRDHLSGKVTDALIENGTREVWRKVSQNKGAEITSKGFDTLVSNASGDQILQASLSARSDITVEAAKSLLPLLPPDGKQRLVSLFEKNSAMAGELLGTAHRRVTAEKLVGRKGRLEAKLMITDVKEGKIQLSDAIIQFAEADRSSDLITFLAVMADMDEPLVSNAFYQENDDPIAILCKSLDVSVDAFTRVMKVRCDKLKLPLSVGGRSIIRYKELDVSSSQRAMRFVQMRKNVGQAS